MLDIFHNSNPNPEHHLNNIHNNRHNYLPAYRSPTSTQTYHQPIHIHHNNPHPHISYLYTILILAGLILFIFFVYDLRSEYDLSVKELDMKKRECMVKYDQNQCLNPVQILVEECKKLRSCYQDENTVKLTLVFARVFAHLLRTIVEGMGFICLMAVLIVIGFYFWGSGSDRASHGIQSKTH